LVEGDLAEDHRTDYKRLLAKERNGTIESVLNRVRLCREMLGPDDKSSVDGLTTEKAVSLDRAICRAIRDRVAIDPPGGLSSHYIFAQWAKTIARAFPLEIFTTNYDLLIETALESAETPYFDGFVGSVSPFFRAIAIDTDFGGIPIPVVPKDWVRLWKLHGSVGWLLVRDKLTGTERIVRRGSTQPGPEEELMIFPSRQKYSDSRRLPFVAYQDRLRRLLASGETLLVMCGYSFADEHINEVVFEALRSNPRLAVTVLCFDALSSEGVRRNLLGPTATITNLTVYGPDAAVVGGAEGYWEVPQGDVHRSFWDKEKEAFRLGDFAAFVDFLRSFLGPRVLEALPSVERQDA
jgi:hypothetical protein